MPKYKYSREDYHKLTAASCLDVAEALGFEIDIKQSTQKAIHLKHSGGLYIFPDKNNWYRHTDGAKGFAVELVMDVIGGDKNDALDFIARNVVNGAYAQQTLSNYKSNYTSASPSLPQTQEFTVPPHDIQPKRVLAYLIKTRGIDPDIAKDMLQRKMIAEDSQHHNCLFFGRDSTGEIRSCAVRGTSTYKQFRGETAGGDKSVTFTMAGCNDTIRLFESPIDALSHASFSKLLGKDWTEDTRLSTNGCGYDSVRRYLSEHPEINKVWICFDNDEGGAKATARTQAELAKDFPDRNLLIKVGHPISGKDWNEDLQNFRQAEMQGISAYEFVDKCLNPPVQSSEQPDEEMGR